MLTSTKVGKELGLTKGTICTLARKGRIPFIQLPSGHRRFDLEAVKAALSSDVMAATFLFPIEKGGA
jgi:excisionase family DNA binding protein